jgi:hypothetical protein
MKGLLIMIVACTVLTSTAHALTQEQVDNTVKGCRQMFPNGNGWIKVDGIEMHTFAECVEKLSKLIEDHNRAREDKAAASAAQMNEQFRRMDEERRMDRLQRSLDDINTNLMLRRR